MKPRNTESTSLAAAAVLLIAGTAVGVQLVLRSAPSPVPLLIVVLGLATACALSLLWVWRLCAVRDSNTGATQRLHAHEASGRQQAERALAASDLKLREIIAIMPMALVIKDRESRVLLFNKAAEQQFGFDFSMVSGTNGDMMFPPEQMAVFLANDQAAFANGQLVVQDDLFYSHLHDEDRRLQTFKKPIFDAATGEPDYLICISVDVTEHKRAEQALRQSYLQLRQLMAHLETAKDEDHRRLAAEIHDELGQNLLALKIDVQMLHARAGDTHPKLRRHVGRALDTLNASIRSVRAIINELHPSTLALGLPAALEWLVAQFEARSGIAASLSIRGADSTAIDPSRTAALFRIVQEALLDIVRQAGAMQVELTVGFDAGQLTITIADDGIAAAARDPGHGPGVGLRGVRARVDMIGGSMLVERRGAGGGTCVSIVVPAPAAAVEMAGAA